MGIHVKDSDAGILAVTAVPGKRYIYARTVNSDPPPFCYQGYVRGTEVYMRLRVPRGHGGASLIVKDMSTGRHEIDTGIHTPCDVDPLGGGGKPVPFAVNYFDRRTHVGVRRLVPDTEYRFRVKLRDSLFVTRELDESFASVNSGPLEYLGTWPAAELSMQADSCRGILKWSVVLHPHDGFDVRGAQIEIFRSPADLQGHVYSIDELVYRREIDGGALPVDGGVAASYGPTGPPVKVRPGDKVVLFLTVETNDGCTVQYAKRLVADPVYYGCTRWVGE